MEPFQNILAYLDVDAEQQGALELAKKLAQEHGAAVSIVSAVDEPPWWAEAFLAGRVARWRETFIEQIKAKLEALAAPLRKAAVPVTTYTLIGRPWLELIREVIRRKNDLVLKDAGAAEPLERICSSEMDRQLVRKCPCPVWLVHRRARRLRRIAAAIDLVPGDDRRNLFNAKILALAAWLAQTEHCPLHVVRAWSIYGESVLKSHMSEEELEQLKTEKRQVLQTALDDFLAASAADLPDVQVHLPEGASEQVIPALVDRADGDLLVMGTITSTGVAGLIIGTAAEQILRQLKCSVLAVKPDQYTSPVGPD